MAVYTHVSAEALGDFLKRYDVGELVSAKGVAEGVENSNYMVDTTKGRFFLTLYEKRVAASDLPLFHGAARSSRRQGFTLCRLRSRIATGVEIQELEGRPACLIKFLPGVSLSHPTAAPSICRRGSVGGDARRPGRLPLERANSLARDGWIDLFERCEGELDTIAPGLRDRVAQSLEHVSRDGRPTCRRARFMPTCFPTTC